MLPWGLFGLTALQYSLSYKGYAEWSGRDEKVVHTLFQMQDMLLDAGWYGHLLRLLDGKSSCLVLIFANSNGKD
jgi:hypothetical protein